MKCKNCGKPITFVFKKWWHVEGNAPAAGCGCDNPEADGDLPRLF